MKILQTRGVAAVVQDSKETRSIYHSHIQVISRIMEDSPSFPWAPNQGPQNRRNNDNLHTVYTSCTCTAVRGFNNSYTKNEYFMKIWNTRSHMYPIQVIPTYSKCTHTHKLFKSSYIQIVPYIVSNTKIYRQHVRFVIFMVHCVPPSVVL